MPPGPDEIWRFLLVGYLFTVAIETPVLLVGLSARHRLRNRFFAGLWLTACTYPIVVLVMPSLVWDRFGYGVYLAVAETFAPVAECLLFWAVIGNREDLSRRSMYRDFAAIVAANLASFLLGLWLL